MSDYTPTTEEVRDQFPDPRDKAWFDRWLATIQAEAWDEGHEAPRECCGSCPLHKCPWDNGQDGPTNPYRERENPDG